MNSLAAKPNKTAHEDARPPTTAMDRTREGERPREPRDWLWVRLGECVTKIGSGLTPLGGHAAYRTDGIPLIRSQNVHLNRFDPQGLVRISPAQDAAMRQSRVVPNDVLLNITGASIGRVCVVPPEICPANVNQHVCIIRLEDTLDPHFVSLFFSSDDFQRHIDNLQSGATRQALTKAMIEQLLVPAPPLPTQRRIAAQLKQQLAEVDIARTALHAQLDTTDALVAATLRETLSDGATTNACIADCLQEVTQGIGSKWNEYPVLGATRAGLAPAKESVGKAPERYKPVGVGTIFYNPMRILLGSIAMVDEGDAPGITSPDYVVMTAKDGVLHPRWFYQWFRSADGAAFVRSLSRGAVRERLLFKRLAPAEIALPPWSAQVRAAEIFQAVSAIRKHALARLATLDRLPAALLRQVFGEAEGGC
jgi:type I restriction enzyme, S subunit